MKKFCRFVTVIIILQLFIVACGGSPAPEVPAEVVESAPESISEQASEPVAESPPDQPTESVSSLFSFVTDAYMARYVDGDYVKNTVFSPEEIVHAVVKFEKIPFDISVKSAWFAVDVEDLPPGFLVEKIIDAPEGKSGQIDFDLSNKNGFPIGDYKIEIYVNGYIVTTLTFSVQ